MRASCRVAHEQPLLISREPRMHIHVQTPEGEAKFWMEPKIELAKMIKLKPKELGRLKKIIEEHREEIINEWNRNHKR
jgi:hypothetical protein